MATHALRQQLIQRLKSEVFDLVIVGGGINGGVAAAALSASGLKVALLEKSDFGSSTSQESSNLVWGGIKYLESYEFGLVWELCRSRNELMRSYPNEVKELRFFTSLERGFRKPRFLVFLGALLYWFMGRFRTQPPRLLSIRDIQREEPNIETKKSQGGLEYSDCYLKDNDARFVFHFIRRAVRRGATAVNYAAVEGFEPRTEGGWRLKVRVKDSHASSSQLIPVEAKGLINAGGPYADRLNQMAGITTRHRHIFSKGVHLIVRRLTPHERVLTFFADDGRLFFVIPMGACSCIGTTDSRVQELPARIEPEDRRFILDNINKRLHLAHPLTEADIISERCGVRPLVVAGKAEVLEQEDWVNLSRKHKLEVNRAEKHISIFGGKLTDCLNIGRELVAAVKSLGISPNPKGQNSASSEAPRDAGLWYGEGSEGAKREFTQAAEALGLHNVKDQGEGTIADRLWRNYGDEALTILQLMREEQDLRTPIIASSPVVLAEAVYMAREELVFHLEDFLRRRTRLALVVPRSELAASKNLFRACEILFGERAADEWQNYFRSQIPA